MSVGVPGAAPTTAWPELDWSLDDVDWVESHVGSIDRLIWRKAAPWAVVAELSTARGQFWFKQVGPVLAAEPALTAALAHHVPRSVAEVIAADRTRLLTRDAGRPMDWFIRRDGGSAAAVWEVAASRYAELELELVPLAAALPAPDQRPEVLARGRGSELDLLLAQLGDAIPMSLVHLDVAKKNVCISGDDVRFLDWSTGVYGHPFLGPVKLLRTLVSKFRAPVDGPDVARVRDAYLEPWSVFAPMRELRRIFAAAYPLGALCRAEWWQRLLDATPSDLHGDYARRPETWLQSFRASLASPGRLGH
jgi:hypothetical protein